MNHNGLILISKRKCMGTLETKLSNSSDLVEGEKLILDGIEFTIMIS